MSDAPAPDSEAPKKSGVMPLAIAVVVALGAGAGAGIFAVGPALAKGIAPQGAHASAAGADAASADDSSSDEASGDESAPAPKGEHGQPAPSSVYVIDNLVLNPAGSGGTRFLLLTVAFEMATPDLLDEMKSRDAEVRDAVLGALGSKTVEQLADVSAREPIKEDLRIALSPMFKKKKAVKRIYFPQFVIQ